MNPAVAARRAWLSRMAAALSLALGALSAGPALAAADVPPQAQALFEAARKEGGATVFGVSLNPDQVAAFERGFAEFYGFPVRLTMLSGLHPAKAAELVQGARLGAPSGIDLFWTTSNNSGTLDQAGLLQAVDWPAAVGADPATVWGQHGMRTHDGTLALVIYNTDLLKPEQAPKSFDDLLDPKYRGRIAAPRTPSPFAYMTYAVGQEKGTRFLTALMKQQNARMLPTFPDVRTRVITGEFALGFGIDAINEQRKGAPVAHAPVDPLVLMPWALWLLKDSQRPNAAKLFAYWLGTSHGQKTLVDIHGLSMVTSEGSPMWKHAQGLKVVIVPHDFMVRDLERINADYRGIMGIR
jgi:iron(III) transport system substrate-binding protein